jgi:hypothetical protein
VSWSVPIVRQIWLAVKIDHWRDRNGLPVTAAELMGLHPRSRTACAATARAAGEAFLERAISTSTPTICSVWAWQSCVNVAFASRVSLLRTPRGRPECGRGPPCFDFC